MTPSNILKALPELFAAQLSVFVKGPVGVGKSALIRQLGQDLGVEVRDTTRLSQMDPTDIKGFPAPDAKKGIMRWLPPSFLPQDPKSKGILFLDELTSASTAVQAAAYQLMLDRCVGEYKLPDGWAIVAAGNREIDRSIVNRMPAALANRMVHIDYEVNLADFVAWATDAELDPITIAFLRFRENLLHSFDPQSKEAAFPTPRTWEFSDRIMGRNLPTHISFELLKGTVGHGAAAEYMAFHGMANKLPTRDEIALNPLGAPVPESLSAQYAVTTMLSMGAKNVGQFRTSLAYMERLSPEFQVVFIKDLIARAAKDPSLGFKSTSEWTKWCFANRGVVL